MRVWHCAVTIGMLCVAIGISASCKATRAGQIVRHRLRRISDVNFLLCVLSTTIQLPTDSCMRININFLSGITIPSRKTSMPVLRLSLYHQPATAWDYKSEDEDSENEILPRRTFCDSRQKPLESLITLSQSRTQFPLLAIASWHPFMHKSLLKKY